ncbi:MAG: helix-turn-helix transcriptional regulator [Thermoanaerobaculia bacterium]
MHELERRARALGFSWPELAREIGLGRSQLAHIRSGRDRISLGTLHRIALWFPNDEAIRRLVWEYLLHDVETQKERTLRELTRSDDAEAFARRLTEPSVALLRAFVAEFPSHAVSGRGLLVTTTDTFALSAALGFLEAELRARRIHAIRQNACDRIAASAVPALIGTPVLFVERVEHASPSMAEILKSRAAYLKVTVATSAQGDGTDGDPLVQLLALRMSRAPVEVAATEGGTR